MDIGSLLLGLALLAVVVFIVARPFLERNGPPEQPATNAEQLVNSRERVLVQLRDLDFDDATGKINAADYATQRAKLVAEGVAILKQLDAAGLAAQDSTALAALADDPIEAAVARKRALHGPAATVVPTPAVAVTEEIESPTALGRAQRPARSPAVAAAQKAVPAKAKAARGDLDAEIEASVALRRSAVLAAQKGGPHEAPGNSKLSCVQCGTDVLPSDRFCPKCGSPQMIACSHCGRVARAGDQFCGQCGQALPASVTGATKT